MLRFIMNIRRLSLLAAVVVAVLAAGSLGPPRQAQAASITDPTGVICGYLHDLVVGVNDLDFSGTVLTRIDDDETPGDFRITAVAYTVLSTAAMPDCKTPQDVAFPAGVDRGSPVTDARPSVTDLTFSGGNKLSGSSCQEDFTFAGQTFAQVTRITLQLELSKNEPAQQSMGSFEFENPYADEAACLVGGQPTVISVQFDALYQDGPDEAEAAFDSDWDKDGVLDWDELDPLSTDYKHHDPFSGPGVGGVAELPEVAGTTLDAAGASGSNAGLIGTLVAIAAAAAATLGGGALYARRRLNR